LGICNRFELELGFQREAVLGCGDTRGVTLVNLLVIGVQVMYNCNSVGTQKKNAPNLWTCGEY
jgi:hypothetical protein